MCSLSCSFAVNKRCFCCLSEVWYIFTGIISSDSTTEMFSILLKESVVAIPTRTCLLSFYSLTARIFETILISSLVDIRSASVGEPVKSHEKISGVQILFGNQRFALTLIYHFSTFFLHSSLVNYGSDMLVARSNSCVYGVPPPPPPTDKLPCKCHLKFFQAF